MTAGEPKETGTDSPRTVAVGTDFSAAAEGALAWATAVARKRDAVLHVVHAVTRTLPLVDRFDPESPLGLVASAYARERLERLEQSLRSPDQPIACHLSHSRPSMAILRLARRVRAELIVTGRTGEGGLGNLQLGSTAERVAQRSSCPVLTVPARAESRLRWPRRILIATDFSIESDAALHQVQDLFPRSGHGTEFLLLTVLYPPDGLESSPEAVAAWRDYAAECRDLLRSRGDILAFSSPDGQLTARGLVREGRPAEEIVRVASEEEVDLIALGGQGPFAAGRSFLGSVSKRVMQSASCPILTVPSLLSMRLRSAARG